MKSSLKTAIADPATGTVVWSEGDGIRVFNDLGQESVLTLVSGAGTPNAVFEGEVFKGSGDTYYAVTPSAMQSSFEGGKITFSLPEEQNYVSGSYDSGACPFTATATLDGSSLNLDFSPAAGLVRFGLRGEGSVTGLTLTDKASGKAYTMTCSAPVALNGSSDTDFYFSVPVGSLSGGFSLQVFNLDGGVALVNTDVDNSVTSGGMRMFESVNAVFEYGLALTEDGVLFQHLAEAVSHLKENAISGLKILGDAPEENLIVDTEIRLDGNGHELGDLVITDEGNLYVVSSSVTFDNFRLEVSAEKKSGQMQETTGSLTVNGRSCIDKVLDPSGNINNTKWYAVCVPFPVDIKDIKGVYDDGSEKELVYGYNYLIDEYDGNKRAKSGKGWVDMPASATLIPGKMYIIVADINICRFYKKDGTPIVSDLTSIQLQDFIAPKIENQGWNAIGNPKLYNVVFSSESTQGSFYNNNGCFEQPVVPGETVLPVSFPLFIKQGKGMNPVVTISRAD